MKFTKEDQMLNVILDNNDIIGIKTEKTSAKHKTLYVEVNGIVVLCIGRINLTEKITLEF